MGRRQEHRHDDAGARGRRHAAQAAFAGYLILALSGCNEIYNLDATKARDAAPKEFFDAPPDAMPMCGTGEPLFQPEYFQILVPRCTSYVASEAWGGAVAGCPAGVRQGEAHEALENVPQFATNGVYRDPRLAHDGDVLLVQAPNLTIELYTRNPDDTWTLDRAIADAASYRYISNPTRGPVRRAIQTDFDGAGTYFLRELVEQPGMWMEVDRYPISEIGLSFANDVSLSPDGLILTMSGNTATASFGVHIARRATVNDRFGRAIRLTTVPQAVTHPFMTESCSRLYFSALQTVFYQKLQ